MARHTPAHPFYGLPFLVQWSAAGAMATATIGALFAVIGPFVVVANPLGAVGTCVGGVTGFCACLLLTPVLQAGLTPVLALTGVYQYVHPVVLLLPVGAKKMDLHTGTLFDLVVQMPKGPATYRQRWLLAAYLDGLVALGDAIEAGRYPPDTAFAVSSHFLSPDLAKRLSLRSEPASLSARVLLLMMAVDIIAMASFVAGRFTWPSLRNIHRIEFTGAELVDRRATLLAVADRVRPKALAHAGGSLS